MLGQNKLPINQIICGDTLEELKKLPDECIDMIMFSPPYYGLRNYQVEGQIGLEPTFQCYLDKMIEIMREVKRVLKKTGTIWINFGDCYGGNFMYPNQPKLKGKDPYKDIPLNKRNRGKIAKCLLMQPERFAIRCIDELGLILRNKIKWAKQVLIFDKDKKYTKGSVMPTSVKDRFNESGEELYFFVKSKKYYSNLDAVRLPPITGPHLIRNVEGDKKIPSNSRIWGNSFNYRVRDAIRKAGQPQFRATEEEITAQIARKYGYDPEGICPICGRKWKRHASPNAFDRKAGIRREFIPCIKRDWKQEEAEGYKMGSVDPHRAALRGGLKFYQGKFAGRKDAEMFNGPRARTQRKYDKENPNAQPKFDDNYWWRFLHGTSHTNRFYKQAFNILKKWMTENECYDYEEFYNWWLKHKDKWSSGTLEERQGKKLEGELPFPKPESRFLGKNLPTVWQINPEPHNFQKELEIETEHFAVYPEALCTIPILFGCPDKICKKCGKIQTKIVQKNYIPINKLPKNHPCYRPSNKIKSKYKTAGLEQGRIKTENMAFGKAVITQKFLGFSKCNCNAGFEPGIVLDPFCGSGTTCLVAKKLGRSYIGIDLNKDYCEIARKRLAKVSEPLL